MPQPEAALGAVREPRWRTVLCFLLMLAGIQVALGPKIRVSQWDLSADRSAGVAEGVAWLQGRLDIPPGEPDAGQTRRHDTAFFHGRVYNVFPPLVGALTAALGPLHRLLLGRSDVWLTSIYTLLAFWPLPILGFVVFRRQTGDSVWAGLLTISWMGGTALLPNLYYARYSHLGQLNHVLSQTGLLLIIADLIGRQRVWPALIGLLIAVWTRQMTALYALPVLWVAWQRRRLPLVVAGLVVIAAPLLVLNWLKFGNPLDFGYQYIYVDREHEFLGGRALRYGLFSPRFIGENAWYMHVAPPGVELRAAEVHFASNALGTSIWITSPILVYVVVAVRRWWADPRLRALMLASVLVMLGDLCYHGSGFLQMGYNRFALDFIPVWMVVAAPATRGGRRTWITVACTAWSLLYFQAIVPDIYVRP